MFDLLILRIKMFKSFGSKYYEIFRHQIQEWYTLEEIRTLMKFDMLFYDMNNEIVKLINLKMRTVRMLLKYPQSSNCKDLYVTETEGVMTFMVYDILKSGKGELSSLFFKGHYIWPFLWGLRWLKTCFTFSLGLCYIDANTM